MTKKSKSKLLTAVLKLIGTHLDEEGNIVRTLSDHLGMTAEEMVEYGVLFTE